MAFLICRPIKIVSIVLSIVVILINTFFVYNTMDDLEVGGAIIAVVGVVGVLYIIFVIYLAIHLAVSMGNKTLAEKDFVKKYVMVTDAKLSQI